MRYVMSDVHGEYALFCALMKKIGFSESDELYICGDIIEKGPESVRLLKQIFSMPNAYAILGNHEDAFLKFYHRLMRESEDGFDGVLSELREYLGTGGELLDWDTVDRIEALPCYLEADGFICVHAGVPLDEEGKIPPLASVDESLLLYSRKFKSPEVLPNDARCVFFGHTATSAILGEDKILAYKKPDSNLGDIRDFAKVHLDTCTAVSGTLGCFCIDTCQAHYVTRRECR